MAESLLKPKSLALQWHITENCNWHCKHCYQDKEPIKEELTIGQMKDVVDQYIFLIRYFGLKKNNASINITGGEAFLREDFFEFLEYLQSRSDFFNFGILSNGSFITKKIAKKLKKIGVDFYQVSIEGLEPYNDSIRGRGSFKKIINAIQILTSEGIKTHASLTLTKDNIDEIPELCNILEKSGAYHINTRRLIPFGTGTQFKDRLIEPSELRNYYTISKRINERFKKEGKNFHISIGCESGIFNDEISVQKEKNYCGVLDGRIIVVMPNGDVLPCRRLPIVIGNVLNQSLFELWYSSNMLWELRNTNNAHPFCKRCKNFNDCFGGAKCVSYTYYKKRFVPDPQCWRYYKRIEDPDFFEPYSENIKKEVSLLGSLESNTKDISYCRKESLVEDMSTKTLDRQLILINADTDLSTLFLKSVKSRKELLLCFDLNEKDLNQKTGEKIIEFFNKLKNSKIRFKVSKPLPRCLFGAKYVKVTKDFKMPNSCYECSELFNIKEGEPQSCKPINKKGPKIYYIKNRNQIMEYFNTLRLLKKPNKTCLDCRYFKRKACDGLCYRI